MKRLAAAVVLASLASAASAADWVSTSAAREADADKASVALDFRREFQLDRRPEHFVVQVSADQRFVLYVNGARMAAGPARSDLAHWRSEEIDLASHLRQGLNIVSAKVWSDGKFAPVAQISAGMTAFRLAATEPAHAALIDTGPTWQVRVDPSRSVASGWSQLIRAAGPIYYAAGAPETIDATKQPGVWSAATLVPPGEASWQLTRDTLPQMRYDRIASGRVVRAAGVAHWGRFPAGSVTVPAHGEASFLIDVGRVLAAYPVLRTSGGAGAEVTLTYTEALYDPVKRRGGSGSGRLRFEDRARVADGEARGLTDTFRLDGGRGRSLAPLWWRAWRFVEVRVKTGDQPLTLNGLDTYETGYPFRQQGRFVSDDEQLNRIWRIGWMTGLLDAHETYMDTAYWEQLQYTGDARLEMLLSYDVAGDPRLAVQALDAFDWSRDAGGMIQAAWPARSGNLIPPFGLLWIGALHDYWMRQPDTAVLTRTLPGVRAVLDWYAPYLRDNGVLRPAPGWPFVDWRPGLDGMAQKNGKGPDNCVVTMLYYGALKDAAALEDAVGEPARAKQDRVQMDSVAQGLKTQCWDVARGLYADTPAKTGFSQHANALAVLYDLVPSSEQRAVLTKVVVPGGGISAPEGITGATYYFSYYLAAALDHAGMGDAYLDLLKTWRDLLAHNFTTWPEEFEPSRSDSHAWSAHPTSGLLTYVAGIQPDAPGFTRVRIAPHLGTLHRLDAAMAHPAGLIETRYVAKGGGGLDAMVRLPAGLTGSFVWNGETRALRPGANHLVLQQDRKR